MKKIVLGIFLLGFAGAAFAQDADGHGFKKENLFTGGSVDVGLGNGTTSLGIQPFFGYSVNRFLDVAVALNYDYVSERGYDYNGNYSGKIRQNVIGPGAFIRVFPVRFLFAQAQFENNFITYKELPSAARGGSAYNYKETHNVSSFLVGAGLAQGRSREDKSYGYISLLFDVAKNKYSPYVDSYGNVNPVIRAGYNIALFQGRRDGGRGRRAHDRE